MSQYIIRALRDGQPVRENVFESHSMHTALEDAKQAWPDLGKVGWLALKGEDYPLAIARLLARTAVTVTYAGLITEEQHTAPSLREARSIALNLVERYGVNAWKWTMVRDAHGTDHRPAELWGEL